MAGRAEKQKQLGRPTHSSEGKREIDLKEIGQEDINWMHKSLRSSRKVTQHRLILSYVSYRDKLLVPFSSVKQSEKFWIA